MPVAKPTTVTDVAEIQRRMAQIRHDMHQEVQGAVKGAQLLTDWRSLVKSYPWLSISLAAVAGYLIVPRRRSSDATTVETRFINAPERLAVAGTPAETPPPRRTSWSIIGTAFSLLTPVAVRVAQNYALGHLEQWLSQHPLPPSPARSPDGPGRDSSRPASADATNRLRHFG
jgi:hypothetical protein